MYKSCVGVLAAVLLSTISWGQQNDSTPKITLLDEVIVTANKVEQKQSQTGKVVSVIGKEQLEKSAGRSLGQILNEQAGITIPGALNSPGSPQTLSVRGGGPGRTLVLIDGVPAYDPSLINSEFDLNFINISNIERIEVCRGAQSTLYGSDAVAGVVNIITQKNNVQNPFNLKATAIGGNLNTYKGDLQAYGKKGGLSYDLRISGLSTEGFSSAYDASGNNDFEKDGYQGSSLVGKVQYRFSPKLDISSFVQRNQYTADADASAFTDEKDFTLKNENILGGAGFHYKGEKISVTGNYQYSDVTRHYLNDSTDVPGFAKYVTDDYYGRNQFLELYSNVKLSGVFQLLTGIDYRFSDMNSQYFSLSAFGPFETQFRDTSMSQASVYGSVLYGSKKLFIEAGGRLNRHSQYGTNATFTFNPSYIFSENWRIFGSIASGFKAPSLYQLYSGYGNPDLDPEKSVNYEIGTQYSGKNASARVVYFKRDINNGIDFDNINYAYFNITKQQVDGFEIEGQLNLSKAISLSGNYTLLTGQETAQSRISTKDTTYQYLLRRPKSNLNLQLGCHFTSKLFASVSGKYVSQRYDVGGYQVPDVPLEGYFLLGAYGEYTFSEKFKIFTDLQNLTNKTFFDLNGYRAIPFMLNMGITIKL